MHDMDAQCHFLWMKLGLPVALLAGFPCSALNSGLFLNWCRLSCASLNYTELWHLNRSRPEFAYSEGRPWSLSLQNNINIWICTSSCMWEVKEYQRRIFQGTKVYAIFHFIFVVTRLILLNLHYLVNALMNTGKRRWGTFLLTAWKTNSLLLNQIWF